MLCVKQLENRSFEFFCPNVDLRRRPQHVCAVGARFVDIGSDLGVYSDVFMHRWILLDWAAAVKFNWPCIDLLTFLSRFNLEEVEGARSSHKECECDEIVLHFNNYSDFDSNPI